MSDPGLDIVRDAIGMLAGEGSGENGRSAASPGSGTPVSQTGTLLDELVTFVRRYVVLSEAQLIAVALWIAHTHTFDAATATPYLSITSPEKESGKSRLLEALELVVARPWMTGRVTAAVLARKVDAEKPTLLLDESDAAFNGEKEYAETLRGILNSGHREGGCASLCVGQGKSITYADLSTFCPKAIAGLDKLPDTVASRSIAIRLKRKAPEERVERFRRRMAVEAAEALHEWLRSWGGTQITRLAEARPQLPDELSDRAQDCWEPLLAIADLAGGEWPGRARRAAIELATEGQASSDSERVRLLADCRTVFEEKGAELQSSELLKELHAIEEAPWSEYGRQRKPLSARGLANLLKPFEIRPRKWWDAGETVRGYRVSDFEDAWSRYLPAHPPDTPEQSDHADSEGFTSARPTSFLADEKPVICREMAGLADRDPDAGELDWK